MIIKRNKHGYWFELFYSSGVNGEWPCFRVLALYGLGFVVEDSDRARSAEGS